MPLLKYQLLARPAFNPEIDDRSGKLTVRIGESEANKVKRLAEAQGGTVSSYLREVVRHHLASQAIESN